MKSLKSLPILMSVLVIAFSITRATSQDRPEWVDEVYSMIYDHEEEKVIQVLDSIRTLAKEIGDLKSQSYSHMLMGVLNSEKFRIDQAIAELDSAEQLYQESFGQQLFREYSEPKAEILFIRGQVEEAQEIYYSLAKNARNIDDYKRLASYTMRIGDCHKTRGQMDSAGIYLENARSLVEDHGLEQQMPNVYNQLGGYYKRTENYEQSITDYLKAVEIIESADSTRFNPYSEYSNLADLFIIQSNIPKAKEYADKTMKIAEEMRFSTYKANAHFTWSRIHNVEGNLDSAYYYANASLGFLKNSRNISNHIDCLMHTAVVERKRGNFSSAIAYANQAKERLRGKDLPIMMTKVLLPMGQFQFFQGDYEGSILTLKEALEANSATDNSLVAEQIEAFLAQNLIKLGKPQEAITHLENQLAIKDRIFENTQAQAVHEVEAKYEGEKKKKEIELLNSQNEIQELTIQRTRQQRLYLAIGFLLAGALAFFSARLYVLKRRSSAELAQKNEIISESLKEKESLLKEIHHRVKNNLQTISSLLALQSKGLDEGAALDALTEGQNRVKSMALIHQNLYQEGNLVGVNVQTYFEKLASNLFRAYRVDKGQIQLHLDIDEVKMDVDRIIPLGLIINELLTNSLKYAFSDGQKGTVTIRLKKMADQSLLLEVADNGKGIPKEMKLEQSKSLGFRLVRIFADKMRADLQIDREEGTRIRLSMPKQLMAG